MELEAASPKTTNSLWRNNFTVFLLYNVHDYNIQASLICWYICPHMHIFRKNCNGCCLFVYFLIDYLQSTAVLKFIVTVATVFEIFLERLYIYILTYRLCTPSDFLNIQYFKDFIDKNFNAFVSVVLIDL